LAATFFFGATVFFVLVAAALATGGFLTAEVFFAAGFLVAVFLAAGFFAAVVFAGFGAAVVFAGFGAADFVTVFFAAGFFAGAFFGATFSLPAGAFLAGSFTRPPIPLGRYSSPFSEPRLIAVDRLLTFDADDMSILYLSARNFLRWGRETPARASLGVALMHSWIMDRKVGCDAEAVFLAVVVFLVVVGAIVTD